MRDHPFVKGVALPLIFLLLQTITTTTADRCSGTCFGWYLCGQEICDCPGTSYRSDCPTECFYEDTSGCADVGLNSFAIAGIVVASIFVLIAVVACGVAACYSTAKKNKTAPDHSIMLATPGSLAGTTTSPVIEEEVQLSSQIPVVMSWPEQHPAATLPVDKP